MLLPSRMGRSNCNELGSGSPGTPEKPNKKLEADKETAKGYTANARVAATSSYRVH